MASGELGTYSSHLRHHGRKHSGDFLRVGRSVCRYQTQWVGHHPSILGFSQMRLFLLLHRTVLKGMSQTLSVLHSYGLEWGRPCRFWLPAKDIPGSNPQSTILQRWSINTSAPSSLGWDHSEACVLYCDLTFPCGVSATHCGKSHTHVPITGCLPFSGLLLHYQMADGVSCVSQIATYTKILLLLLAFGETRTDTGVRLDRQDWLSSCHVAGCPPLFPTLRGYRIRVKSPQSESACGDAGRGQSQITVFP